MSSPKKCLLSLIRDINFLFFIYVVHLYTHLSVAFATGVPPHLYAFHRYTEASPSFTSSVSNKGMAMLNITSSAAWTPPLAQARSKALWVAWARVEPCTNFAAKACASASSSASATTRLIMPKRSIVAAGTRSEVTRHISSRRGPRQEGLTTESLHQSWSLSPGKLASAAKGGAVRSVRKAVAEHREPALRTVARGLVLDNVPVFGELAIFNTNYVDHDPVYRGAES